MILLFGVLYWGSLFSETPTWEFRDLHEVVAQLVPSEQPRTPVEAGRQALHSRPCLVSGSLPLW